VFALFLHLDLHPEAKVESMQALIAIGRQPEHLLAGYAVLALGTIGPRAWAESQPLFEEDEEHREEKAFLMLAPGAHRKLKFLGSAPDQALPNEHPTRQILSWLGEPFPAGADGWRGRWNEHMDTFRWVLQTKKGTGWNKLIWDTMHHFFGTTFEESLVPLSRGPDNA
jgi:hypothetical protein